MRAEAERADSSEGIVVPVAASVWPRVRNALVWAGDVVGVGVLILAVVIIGSHGTSLDFMTAATGR